MGRQTRRRPGPPYDLFGEIPVTLDELLAWMLAVPGIPPTSSRFAYYVRNYLVIDKIRQAKLAGTFEDIVSAPDTPAPLRIAAAFSAASFRASAQARDQSRHRR